MIECRAAHDWELDAAAALRQEMALEMGNDFDSVSPGWRSRFRQYFGGKRAAQRGEVFLAFDGSTPVGCAFVSILDDYRAFAFGTTTAVVNGVFVKPEYRRQGLARQLMQRIFDWAREAGCVRIRLRSSDEGRPLYQKLGFRQGREMEMNL